MADYAYDPNASDLVKMTQVLTNVTMDYLQMRQDANQGIVTTRVPSEPTTYPVAVAVAGAADVWYKKPIVILAVLAVVGYGVYRYAQWRKAK